MSRWWGVVATRDRPGDLADCLDALARQADRIVVVNNDSAGHPQPRIPASGRPLDVIVEPGWPPNLSRLWNLGLNVAYEDPDCEAVAVVNDDAVVPRGWLAACVGALRTYQASVAHADPTGQLRVPRLVRGAGPVSVHHRITGWAFVLNAAHRLMLDERFRWWYGDDDLTRRAAACGGIVAVPGHTVIHRHPNEQTVGALAEQASRDRAAYVAKWNAPPW